MRFVMSFLCGALALAPVVARAQSVPPQSAASDPASSTSVESPGPSPRGEETSTGDASRSASQSGSETGDEPSEPAVQLHGAVELAYGYNFNEPSNRITDWRWYDSRHNTLGLQNVLLETAWNAGPVKGHVQLQLGVFAELWWPGTRSPELDILWRLMQEVTIEWRTPHRPLSIEGGVFNVPFGPEYNVAYLNWNWSTSNLFALMPYQIGGFRVNYDLGRGRRARFGVYNGWDQIVSDNNDAKSVMASFEWDDPDDELNYFYVNYMVGDERDFGDARGPYARHTLDVYGQWHLLEKLSLRAHFFGGVAPTRGDTLEGWVGGALFARFDLTRWFSIAGRGDVVHTFSGPDGEDIFHADVLPDPTTATLMGSGTLTLDLHPSAYLSIRLEGRHDRANFPRFFSGRVPQTMPMMGMGAPQDVRTASDQTTVTLGMTAWF